MSVNTYVENMRNLHFPEVPLPRALYFKEVGDLACKTREKFQFLEKKMAKS